MDGSCGPYVEHAALLMQLACCLFVVTNTSHARNLVVAGRSCPVHSLKAPATAASSYSQQLQRTGTMCQRLLGPASSVPRRCVCMHGRWRHSAWAAISRIMGAIRVCSVNEHVTLHPRPLTCRSRLPSTCASTVCCPSWSLGGRTMQPLRTSPTSFLRF